MDFLEGDVRGTVMSKGGSDADEKRMKKTFVRRVAAPSIIEAYHKLDEMCHSMYDMYQVRLDYLDEPEGYVELLVFAWENDTSRDYLNV